MAAVETSYIRIVDTVTNLYNLIQLAPDFAVWVDVWSNGLISTMVFTTDGIRQKRQEKAGELQEIEGDYVRPIGGPGTDKSAPKVG